MRRTTLSRRERSRRNFLLGAGGITFALPMLEYFMPRTARASDGAPCRFIAVSHHQGTVHSRWTPAGTETDFVLPELLAACEPFRDRLLVIAGLDNRVAPLNTEADGHSSCDSSLWTHEVFSENIDGSGGVVGSGQAGFGGHGGPSIDQYLAAQIGASAPFTSIDLAIGNFGDAPLEVQSVDSLKFARDRDQPVSAIVDPRLTFDYLFSDPGLTDPEALEALRERRLSVLDAVQENFADMRARVGAQDRIRLEAHADHVRSIEMRLADLPQCDAATPTLPAGYNQHRDDDVSAPIQVDLMVLAMACGLSNVGTLNFTDGHGPTFPWVEDPQPIVPPPPADWNGDPNTMPPDNGYTEWHDMVHRGLNEDEQAVAAGLSPEPGLIAGMRWYSETFAYLLERLAATPAAEGGSLLDTTLVTWLSEFGNGGWHAPRRLPAVVAGSMGPRVPMGRFLDWENPSDWGTGAYCTGQLFTSILRAFGLQDESFGRTGSYSLTNSFGDVITAELPTGPLPL
ncbi:MAG: DUF1552 domain-containing protein [Myxococcota bacterium]